MYHNHLDTSGLYIIKQPFQCGALGDLLSISAAEEQILASLRSLQQQSGSGGEIEAGLLLQSVQDQPESWNLIGKLYSKQRLRIKIAPVVFE